MEQRPSEAGHKCIKVLWFKRDFQEISFDRGNGRFARQFPLREASLAGRLSCVQAPRGEGNRVDRQQRPNDPPAGGRDVVGSLGSGGSGFFEFVPVDEIHSPHSTVLEAHEPQEEAEYYILLTNAGGLYRYNIQEVVSCTDRYQSLAERESAHDQFQSVPQGRAQHAPRQRHQEIGQSLRRFGKHVSQRDDRETRDQENPGRVRLNPRQHDAKQDGFRIDYRDYGSSPAGAGPAR